MGIMDRRVLSGFGMLGSVWTNSDALRSPLLASTVKGSPGRSYSLGNSTVGVGHVWGTS